MSAPSQIILSSEFTLTVLNVSHTPVVQVQIFSSHVSVSRFHRRCVKTYEVEFSKDGATFQRVNFRDTVFTSHTFSPGELDYFSHTHTPASHICISVQMF